MANRLIKKIDYLIVKSYKWQHIPFTNSEFLYLNIHPHKGKTKVLTDGTLINKGDLIGEIHIDNKNLKNLNTNYSSLIRILQSELKALKNCYSEHLPKYSQIKAIYGITVFHDILKRQGFTVLNVDNWFLRIFGSLWENILRLTLKTSKKRTRKKFIFSKECWLSTNQINSMVFREKIKINNIQ